MRHGANQQPSLIHNQHDHMIALSFVKLQFIAINITGSEKTVLSCNKHWTIKSKLFTTPGQARLIQVLFFNVAFHYLCYRAIQLAVLRTIKLGI